MLKKHERVVAAAAAPAAVAACGSSGRSSSSTSTARPGKSCLVGSGVCVSEVAGSGWQGCAAVQREGCGQTGRAWEGEKGQAEDKTHGLGWRGGAAGPQLSNGARGEMRGSTPKTTAELR